MSGLNRCVLFWFLFGLFVDDSYQEFDCNHNMFVDGCSIPFGINFPFSRGAFLPACNIHDVCYQCGAAFGLTRRKCDKKFRDNMMETCMSRMSRRHILKFAKKKICKKFVKIYFGAVRIGGKNRYTTSPPAECRSHWISQCL